MSVVRAKKSAAMECFRSQVCYPVTCHCEAGSLKYVEPAGATTFTVHITNGRSLRMISKMKMLAFLMLGAGTLLAETYYPPSESAGGWRRCRNDDDLRNKAGMDPKRLHLIAQEQSQVYGGPLAIAILRNGYLVGEWFGVPAMPATTFDVWSCTKSATGIAFGMLFDDSRNHRLPGNVTVDLDSPAYDFIPEGHPLTDPRKEKIRLKHLLSMT